jgi:hypothetical protein
MSWKVILLLLLLSLTVILLMQGNQCQPLGQPAAASAAGQPANSEFAPVVIVNPPQPPPDEQPPLGFNSLLGHVDDEVESARQGMLVVRDVLPSVMQSIVLLLSQSCILSVVHFHLVVTASLTCSARDSLTNSIIPSLTHSCIRSHMHACFH